MVYLLSIVPSPYGYGTKSERREWWSDGTVGKGIYGNEVSRVKVLICLPSREAHFIPCQLPSSSVSWSSVTFLGCPSTLATLATRSPTPSPYPPEGHRGTKDRGEPRTRDEQTNRVSVFHSLRSSFVSPWGRFFQPIPCLLLRSLRGTRL